MTSAAITVSQIAEYNYCPRRIFLRSILQVNPAPKPVHHIRLARRILLKELAFQRPNILKREQDLQPECEKALCLAVEKTRSYPELKSTPQDAVAKAADELRLEMPAFAQSLMRLKEEAGSVAANYLTPAVREPNLNHLQLNIRGTPDYMRQTPYAPVIIAENDAGRPKENEIFKATAYALINCAKSNAPPVSYLDDPLSATFTPVIITEARKNQVIESINAVQNILTTKKDSGVCPHGSHKKCAGCIYEEPCYRT
ncbi:Uncharacterised protein [uncultured archaeon]|nr:Uncharacterised protein [uncultured archaeon]